MTALDILQKYWKYPAFRPGQEDIITAAVAGRDVLALLPTGGGKSICFQVPGMLHHGTTLVISPLIALMTDQVNQLKDRGIEAEAIHAGLPWKTAERILDNTASGAVKFLYVSPERLVSERFRDRLPYLQIKLLVVDEAHCISQWGYDFRPPYLRIAEARELLLRAGHGTYSHCNGSCGTRHEKIAADAATICLPVNLPAFKYAPYCPRRREQISKAR